MQTDRYAVGSLWGYIWSTQVIETIGLWESAVYLCLEKRLTLAALADMNEGDIVK